MKTNYWRLVDPETGKYVVHYTPRLGVSFTSRKRNATEFTTREAKLGMQRLWSLHINVWPEEVDKEAQTKQSNFLVATCIMVWVAVVGLLIYCGYVFASSKPKPAKHFFSLEDVVVEDPTEFEQGIFEKPSVFDKSVELCKYYYADRLATAVIKASEKHDIPVYVLYALFMTESELRLNPKNKCGLPYYGIGQLGQCAIDQYNWKHSTRYTVKDVTYLETGVEISAWYFKWCYSRTMKYTYDYTDAYGAYNAGYETYRKNRHDMRAGWLYGKRYRSMERFNVMLERCHAHFYETF